MWCKEEYIYIITQLSKIRHIQTQKVNVTRKCKNDEYHNQPMTQGEYTIIHINLKNIIKHVNMTNNFHIHEYHRQPVAQR